MSATRLPAPDEVEEAIRHAVAAHDAIVDLGHALTIERYIETLRRELGRARMRASHNARRRPSGTRGAVA